MSIVGVSSSKPTESDVPVYAQSQKCSTMLQTAVVNVKSKNKVVRATLLFDSGSDKSYVTHSLVKRVRPEWVSSEPLRYATFGSGKANPCEIRNVFKLELEGNYGQSESLIAVEIPVPLLVDLHCHLRLWSHSVTLIWCRVVLSKRTCQLTS